MIYEHTNSSVSDADLTIIKGDFNSIRAYGAKPQSRMIGFSKMISAHETGNDGIRLSQTLDRISERISLLSMPSKKTWMKHSKLDSRSYQSVLQDIENVAIDLRSQEAQLLKNAHIFELLAEKIENCNRQFEHYIEYGKQILVAEEDAEERHDEWCKRFSERLSELTTSHIVSMQTEAQMRLMKHNNELLADRIATVLATTIPIWNNQIALVYELDGYEQANHVTRRLEVLAKQETKRNMRVIKKRVMRIKKKEKHDSDLQEIQKANDQLILALQQIANGETAVTEDHFKLRKILLDMNQ